MSGIFGILKNKASLDSITDSIEKLEKYNGFYGHEASDEIALDSMGLGCALEHISSAPLGNAIISADDKYAVIDALLYNREELIEKLNIDCDISDEELLYKWIDKKGFSELYHVNGDFAGAIYDKRKNRLTLFRDHMGVRPLFWYLDIHKFVFATDYRGILSVEEVNKSLNNKLFYLENMGYNSLSLCETEFQNIQCVRPGSYMEVEWNGEEYATNTHVYWEPGKTRVRMFGRKAYERELRRLITDSVNRRLNVIPGLIGAELSGGLDSGVIDLLIVQAKRSAHFVSWSTDPLELPLQDGEDERKIVAEVSRLTKTDFDYLPTTTVNLDSDKWIERLPMPYLNTPHIGSTAALLREKGARFVFTGHGGDEGVSHRCNVFELWYNHEYFSYIRELWFQTKGEKLRTLRVMKRLVINLPATRRKFLKSWSVENCPGSSILNSNFKEKMQKNVIPPTLTFAFDPKKYVMNGGSRNRMDNVAFQGTQNGVRYVLPYLDYRVMDFALSIPRKLYINKGVKRYIFREAFKDILPESLYTVNYKDFPSHRNIKIDSDVIHQLQSEMKHCRNMLDENYWKDYLDFKAVDEYINNPAGTDEGWDEERIAYCLSEQYGVLINCACLQRLIYGEG